MAESCEGTAYCDDIEEESLCWDCGCEWDFGTCFFEEIYCEGFGNQGDCEDCGCDWVVTGTNVQINIGDVWKDVDEIKINIGDTWRTVTEIWINIGDTWRQVF